MNLLRPIWAVVFGLSVGTSIFASEESSRESSEVAEEIDILQFIDDCDPFNDPTFTVFDCARQNEHGKFIELEKLELKERDHHSKKVKLSSSCGSCKIVIDKLNKLCESCRQPKANEFLENIDNLELDEEFFKSAFGISDKCNLLLGTDENGNQCPIITIQSDEHYRKIMEAFNILASNIVGKQLLSRILIEIMRQDKQGKSCEEFSYSMASCLDELERHVVCSLRINADVTTMSTKNGRFEFQLEEDCPPSINIQDIGTCAFERSSSLFHEMLHWYHLLRCKARYLYERGEDIDENYPDLCYISDPTFMLGFVNGVFNNRQNLKCEEMRTVIGAHLNDGDKNAYKINGQLIWFGFLPGDELSENLYRKSLKLSVRVSHNEIAFISGCLKKEVENLYD